MMGIRTLPNGGLAAAVATALLLATVGRTSALEGAAPRRGALTVPQACSGFVAESQVALREQPPLTASDDGRRVDFSISVTVTNPCPDPLVVQYGSFVEYETSFPASPGKGLQAPRCAGERWSFAGEVLPRQQSQFLLRVEGCRAAEADGARVRVTSGRIVTPRGERPVPGVTGNLP